MYSTRNPEGVSFPGEPSYSLQLSDIERFGVSKEATLALLKMQANRRDPKTDKPLFSHENLGEMFGLSAVAAARKLRALGIYRQPTPRVCHDELPENQRAFFLGLALGDFQVNRKHLGGIDLVMVGTESDKPYRRNLLKCTIGNWGEIRDYLSKVKIYVDAPIFDFMVEPLVDDEYFKAKTIFAPFLLGIIAVRLSNRQNRLSLRDRNLLGRIHECFFNHFRFSMGDFKTERRLFNQNEDGEEYRLPVVSIKDPGEVLSALLKVKSVTSLPFLPELAKLSSE